MIVSNLPVVMAQRKVYKLTDIWRATGISRTTLTSLFYGKGDGVRFDTLDALCEFLNCDIGELLQRVPNN